MKLVFCGVGALGSTAAVLCRSLGAELRLVDFDRVESKNLSAQAFVKQSLGKNKAEALKLQLWNFWAVKAEAMPVRVGADNVAQVCGGGDLIVDCFDNQASRQVLSAHARATGLPLVHAALSADGRFGLVRWDERFTADAEDARRPGHLRGRRAPAVHRPARRGAGPHHPGLRRPERAPRGNGQPQRHHPRLTPTIVRRGSRDRSRRFRAAAADGSLDADWDVADVFFPILAARRWARGVHHAPAGRHAFLLGIDNRQAIAADEGPGQHDDDRPTHG